MQPRFANVFCRSENLLHELRRNLCLGAFAASHLRGHRATDAADLAFEFAHAGFAGVVLDYFRQRGRRPLALLALQSILRELPPHEVSLRDFQFLAIGVAGNFDRLHAVAQRGRHIANVVRRGDEDDLREIERHVEVVIDEGVVLSRVEHLEQGARGIAAEVRAELVDFVEHDDRVARAAAAQFLDEPAGHRSDVGAAMPANLRFVAHAAEAHARELAAKRVGDGLAEAGLADAGRSEKAEDRTAALGIQFAHREIFDETAFNLLEIEVIAVEDSLGAVEVEVVLAQFVPRQLGNGLDVADDD